MSSDTGSGAFPHLRVGAEEVAAKLSAVQTPEARRLQSRLYALADELRSWTAVSRPTEEKKRATIDELIALLPRGMSLVPPPPARPDPPPRRPPR